MHRVRFAKIKKKNFIRESKVEINLYKYEQFQHILKVLQSEKICYKGPIILKKKTYVDMRVVRKQSRTSTRILFLFPG